MRPLLLVALALVALPACRATCTSEALSASLDALPDDQPGATAALVAGQCKVADGLAGWLAAPDGPVDPEAWAAVCPAGVDAERLEAAPRLAERREVYAACGFADLGLADVETFAAAEGRPGLAAAATRALLDDPDVDPATARAIGRRLLGVPALDRPLDGVPRLPVEPGEDPGPVHVQVTADAVQVGEGMLTLSTVRSAPPHGPTGHGVEALVDLAEDLPDSPLLAVPASLDGPTLARILASVAPQTPVRLLAVATVDGRDHLPTDVMVGAPHASPRRVARMGPHAGGFTLYDADPEAVPPVDGTPVPPVEGCPAPGPTLCQATVSDLVGSLAEADGPVAVSTRVSTGELAALASRVPDLHLDGAVAPCLDPPAGMVCVPGGPVLVGDGRGAPGGEPALVSLSTFYLDAHEASVADYQACVDAGACGPVRLADDPALPATPLTYVEAMAYCAYRGKVLPTEWQWERAARGLDGPRQDLTPSEGPGDPTPSCAIARHAGCGDGPRPVTEGETVRGFRNLLGNVAEFTRTMPGRLREDCGAACQGWDPLGPCDGAPMCKGRISRVVRGGSFDEPASTTTPAWRTDLRKTSRRDGHGVRCASEGPVLHTFPPRWTAEPPPEPAPPAPLSDAARAILAGIAEDAIDEIPECTDGRRGYSKVDCKDPTHYIYPNEDRGHVTYPYLRHRGGALLGVGSDQNYTFAAVARSELLFLMDYDAIVVHIHRVNQAFVKHAETPEAFVALWDPANAEEADRVIAAEWEGDPLVDVYRRTRRSLNRVMHRHYTRTLEPSESGATSWLRDAGHYAWIRNLWTGGRVVTLKGDMLGPNAMQGVGAALHELGVPMRIYYTSNAPNAWGGEMTDSYKRNVRSFPMDEDSVVLQALGWTNEFGQTGHWHFNVQHGPDAQERLGRDGYRWLWQVVRPYRNTDDVDLTLSGLPGTWEAAHRRE